MKHLLSLIFIVFCFTTYVNAQYLPTDFVEKFKNSSEYMPVSIAKNAYTERYLKANHFQINDNTKNWYYLFIKGTEYYQLLQSEVGRFVYVDHSEPVAMNDSARVTHKVNEVHNGITLPNKYTGKNVVLGIIDSGIDFLHEDFKDNSGKTRVYRYWDQSNKSPSSSPNPYNYGMLWTNTDIDNGKCTAVDNSGHGTNVAGIAAGNGRANGKNKGIAPDATIIIVETNLSSPSWTLTVADACDYIFKVADSLGLPAVINNSNGVQFGSHDGSDPASEKIEALLETKPGRILVVSAGNSGNAGKYHIHGDVTSDTSFYWVKPSVNGIAGANTIYVDMWSDSSDFSNIKMATGANLNSGTYSLRGTTVFRTFQEIFSKPSGVLRDTLYGLSGNKLAYVDYYATIVNHVAEIEWVVTKIDSTNYYYQFRTTGNGSFDGWSGELNKNSNGKTYTDFITTYLPSNTILPAIKNYILADTLQTIFSSFISSEKVITVGNISNRDSYKAKDGNTYYSSVPSGKIFTSSSKGPNRKNVVKPDISACGNFTLTAAPLYVLNNSAFNHKIDEGGMHYVNGGTSMASPMIAGIAALYLEKCADATYQDFKNDLTKSASSNKYAGSLPNFAYGYGIADALKLLNNTNNVFTNVGDSVIQCGSPANVQIKGVNTIKSISWSDLNTSTSRTITTAGYHSFISLDSKKCYSKDSIKIISNNSKPILKIQTNNGTTLNCTTHSITAKVKGGLNYSWTGILQSNLDSLVILEPGKYYVTTNISTPCEAIDSITIMLDTIKPNINIRTNGIKSISCLDEPLKLIVSGGVSYSWNGGNFSKNDTNEISLPGVYKVIGISENGCQNIDSITIFKDPNPNVFIQNNGMSQFITCKQKSISLKALGAMKYTWNTGSNSSGDNNQIDHFGMVIVTGEDSKGCIGKDSILIETDTLKPNLNLKFIGSKDISCNNDPVVIQAFGAINYLWSGGKNVTSSKNILSNTGTYTVIGTNLNGCYTKDSVTIIKTNYPSTPTIEFKDSILSASKSINYQWYKDGNELLNDTLQILKVKENGIYMVAVNLNGCVSTSKYLKTNLDVESIDFTNYLIQPNPLITNHFEIKNLTENTQIEIKDITGKNIEFQRIDIEKFEVNNLVSGVYFVTINDRKQTYTFKILKN